MEVGGVAAPVAVALRDISNRTSGSGCSLLPGAVAGVGDAGAGGTSDEGSTLACTSTASVIVCSGEIEIR